MRSREDLRRRSGSSACCGRSGPPSRLRDWLSLWSALGRTLCRLRAAVCTLASCSPWSLVGSIAAGSVRDGEDPRQAIAPGAAPDLVTLVVVSLAADRCRVEASTRTSAPNVATSSTRCAPGGSAGSTTRSSNAATTRACSRVDRFNSQLWEVYAKKPATGSTCEGAGLKRFTGDFAQTELIPSFVARRLTERSASTAGACATRTTQKCRPRRRFRVAVLGPRPSWAGASATARRSRRCSKAAESRARWRAVRRYEILNFGVPGYQPPQQLVALESVADVRARRGVLRRDRPRESRAPPATSSRSSQKGIAIPYPALEGSSTQAGLDARHGRERPRSAPRAVPRRDPRGGLPAHRRARRAQRGIVPVWIFLPQVQAGTWQEETPRSDASWPRRRASSSSNLGDVYRGKASTRSASPNGTSIPTRAGTGLIAERLYA